jgi:hypothetical protein
MSEQSTDELRLRATEAQMRRALGLGTSAPARAQSAHATSPGTVHAHRRHFARDGEVPVTVIHHDDPGGFNKLEAARQALGEQIAAREQIERQLEEVRVTVQALETQLAHERIAKEEAIRRAENERQAIERQLEQERDAAIAARQEVEERLREMMEPPGDPQRVRRARKAGVTFDRSEASELETPIVPATRPADDTATLPQTRRRGRPPKVRQPEAEFVEWWVPGWREQFR